MPNPGILLCGINYEDGSASVLGRIIGLTGFGIERLAVDNIHNDLSGGWVQRLYSCLRALKPFRVTVVFESNTQKWITSFSGGNKEHAITWPIEDGYTTGALWEFEANWTDVVLGSPDIQQRVTAEITITPTGALTITTGTEV